MAASSSSSFTPSSSSPTKKNTTKSSRIQQTLFMKPSSSSSSSKPTRLTKRQETVFKKAYELSVLCGIELCVICYGSNGELKTWPEDRDKVKDMARRYSELSKAKRSKGSVDLREFLEKIKKEDSKNKKKKKKKKKKVILESNFKYPDWDPRFDNYSVEQLTQLIQSLERNFIRMQLRLRAVVEARRQSNKQNTNMAGQEQRMTTTATMNHLQQHSNHVPTDLLNHGNGTLSQIPHPASAFDQGQSLAPLPSSLMIYPNSNMGNCSRLLGVQETGMNEYPNVLTYNANSLWKQFYQNCQGEDFSSLRGVQETGINNMNVEGYSGLPGMQGTGTNGFQNMDMSMYNSYINTNGLSHQHVQFPTQRAAPAFQYMDR